jgi:F-type H+-transporting ATPase subunit b
MRRLVLALLIAAGAALAAETGHGEGHEGGDSMLVYKWINFAILAGGIGWIAVKVGGPALRGQQKQILDDMNAAARRAEEASAEAAAIERRIAGLDTEVAVIRIQAETAAMLARAEESAGQELASAVQEARRELKAYAARLALDLAAEKAKARMTGEAQSALAARFTGWLGEAGGPEA